MNLGVSKLQFSNFAGPIEFAEPKRDTYHLALDQLTLHIHVK